MGTRLALVRAAVALVVLALGVVAPARGAIEAWQTLLDINPSYSNTTRVAKLIAEAQRLITPTTNHASHRRRNVQASTTSHESLKEFPFTACLAVLEWYPSTRMGDFPH